MRFSHPLLTQAFLSLHLTITILSSSEGLPKLKVNRLISFLPELKESPTVQGITTTVVDHCRISWRTLFDSNITSSIATLDVNVQGVRVKILRSSLCSSRQGKESYRVFSLFQTFGVPCRFKKKDFYNLRSKSLPTSRFFHRAEYIQQVFCHGRMDRFDIYETFDHISPCGENTRGNNAISRYKIISRKPSP